MIDRKEVFHINGIYTSVLFKDWYAAEFLVQRGGRIFRMRVPYKTRAAAAQTVDYLNGRASSHPAPDYRLVIHIMEQGREK